MIKISRILHAGYVFESGKAKIIFDPIFENPFSRNCYAFPNVQFDREQIKTLNFDAIFISHFHDDHCSMESLNLLDRKTPIYLYCVFKELFEMIRELGFVTVYSLELDVPVTIGGFQVIPRRALDSDVDSIFQVKAEGLNVLNVVDSCIDSMTLEELQAEGPWDMVLWPFQAMRETDVLAPSRATEAACEIPVEWIHQLKVLNPRYVVPSSCQFQQESWSWYNHALFPITYKRFAEEVGQALPGAEVVRMNPSVSVLLEEQGLSFTAPLSWVIPVGEQDVDYDFKKEIIPPATSEIAKHFSALADDQTGRVLQYCRTGILEKYNSMEPPLDEYFDKPRFWMLSVYDHLGNVTRFNYLVNGKDLELADGLKSPLGWLTEVPIAKLYAALELGESLTSMYMRINDMDFEAEIEREIKNADIVDDPLIRCLFNGEFGAYQREQMKLIN